MHTKLKPKKKFVWVLTEGTLMNIGLDEHIDCLFKKLTEIEKYSNNYVIRNLNQKMKIHEINKEPSCDFDERSSINSMGSEPLS